jgi:hypothetical protein
MKCCKAKLVLQGEAGLGEFPLHQGEAGVAKAAAAHLFRQVGGEEDQGEAGVAEAAAAHLFRQVGGEEAHLHGLRLDVVAELLGHGVVALDLLFMGAELALHEGAEGVHQHALLVADLKIHRTRPEPWLLRARP